MNNSNCCPLSSPPLQDHPLHEESSCLSLSKLLQGPLAAVPRHRPVGLLRHRHRNHSIRVKEEGSGRSANTDVASFKPAILNSNYNASRPLLAVKTPPALEAPPTPSASCLHASES